MSDGSGSRDESRVEDEARARVRSRIAQAATCLVSALSADDPTVAAEWVETANRNLAIARTELKAGS